MPGQYLLGFLTFAAFRNSFLGALPPMVGQSFLQAGSSPEADGPASAAIWANFCVGNDDSDQPTSTSLFASSTRPIFSSNACATSLEGEELLAGEGQYTGEGGSFLITAFFLTLLAHSSPFLCLASSSHLFAFWASRALSFLGLNTVDPSLSFFGVIFILAILFQSKERRL